MSGEKYENQISNLETKPDFFRLEFSFSYFEFDSDFEFRISSFPHSGGSVSLSLLDSPYINNFPFPSPVTPLSDSG